MRSSTSLAMRTAVSSSSKVFRSVSFVSESEEMNPTCRNTMEDAHLVIDGFANVPDQGLFAIFDGHGGRGVVDHLAESIERNMIQELQHDGGKRSVQECFVSAFLITDIESAKKNLMVSGSTAACCLIRREKGTSSKSSSSSGVAQSASSSPAGVAAAAASSQNESPSLLEERVLYTANVGDTRAVLCRANGVATRLTFDHKASEVTEMKRIEHAGGFIMRKRVLGILSVSRSFGDHSMKKYVLARPHTSRTVLRPDDQFLIVACDGVWDVLSDQEAVDLVRTFLASSSSVVTRNEVAAMLVTESLSRGSTDNVTALVIGLD